MPIADTLPCALQSTTSEYSQALPWNPAKHEQLVPSTLTLPPPLIAVRWSEEDRRGEEDRRHHPLTAGASSFKSFLRRSSARLSGWP